MEANFTPDATDSSQPIFRHRSSIVRTGHNLTTSSSAAVASHSPSGEKVMALIQEQCQEKAASRRNPAASHRVTAPWYAVASNRPSGEKASAVNEPAGPATS